MFNIYLLKFNLIFRHSEIILAKGVELVTKHSSQIND